MAKRTIRESEEEILARVLEGPERNIVAALAMVHGDGDAYGRGD